MTHDIEPVLASRPAEPAASTRFGPVKTGLLLLSGAVLLVVLLLALLAIRPLGLTDWLIDSIYKNVADPIDGEMPTTVMSFPASPQVVGVLGGKGEGLDCSIPWYVKTIFPTYRSENDTSRVERRFRQACVFHDLCYRHGLATYGYTQNDCDRMLHEQAFRICAYLPQSPSAGQCQLDAKKVLAGVTFGGASSFMGWEQSTYFEFDPNPEWSDRFTAVRVMDNPFKPIDPGASKDDPDQLMLTFDVKRSGVETNCVNCRERTLSPREVASTGIDPTSGESFTLGVRRLVWLPPRASIAAPHLLMLDDQQQALLWANRMSSDNSMFCFALADPKNLLTSTIPSTRACSNVNRRLAAGAVDLFSSSPQPVVSGPAAVGPGPKASVAATAITPQRPKRCGACASGDITFQIIKSRPLGSGLPPNMEIDCDCLATANGQAFVDFGIFQNFSIIKGSRQIYLSRGIADAYDDADGTRRQFGLRALVFDVQPGRSAAPMVPMIDRSFDVSETYDPMVPISRDKDDFRLLNVLSTGHVATLYETDVKEARDPRTIPLTWGAEGTGLTLHRSWVRRPIQVVETRPHAARPAVSQLVLSRSLISAKPGTVVFEFLVLQRDTRSDFAAAYSAVRSARCNVRYLPERLGGAPACKRLGRAENESRQTVQSRLQGAQLVVGQLTNPPSTEFDLALQDVCWPDDPVVLAPRGKTFSPAQSDADGRVIACDPTAGASDMVLGPGAIAADIVDLR